MVFNQGPVPGDKMFKLFLVQALSSFVSRDYESGLHYINEIKSSYAEFQSSMNPTLKKLAKEIIQSLDMFAPGSSAEVFMDSNTTVAHSPQQEMANVFQQAAQQPSDQQQTTQQTNQPSAQQQTTQQPASVTSDLQDLLKRRRAKRK